MKKIILNLSLLIGITASAQTTTIIDSNFEKTLIELGIDSDKTVNGKILNIDAEKVTELDIEEKSIGNLTGIEAFINLTQLKAGWNNIHQIDLTKNKALVLLYLNDNEIETINLSENLELFSTKLSHNYLKNIDLKNNKNLVGLDISYNELIALNIDFNSNLQFLFANSNKIKQLDLSKNILLKTLTIRNNEALTCINILRDQKIETVNKSEGQELSQNCYGFNNNTSISEQNNEHEQPKKEIIEVEVIDKEDIIELIPQEKEIGYTKIPDPNFEKALIDLNIDTDGLINGKIKTSDITNQTDLDVTSKNISSLKGIEDFISLVNLQASGNNINKLNLSNNRALQLVYVNENKITSLNITNNFRLKYLSAFENNLKNLDVSKNFRLEILGLWNNQLQELNITNCPVLYMLALDHNYIKELDVTQNLKMKQLSLAHNALINLDVSKNVELEFLSLGHNNFTAIDVTKNLNLEALLLTNNTISELNVTNNSKLKKLKLYNNKISSLDISANLELTELVLLDCNLSELDLSKHHKLTLLAIEGNTNLHCVPILENIEIQELVKDKHQKVSSDCSKI